MGKRKKPQDDVRMSRSVHETGQWVTAQKGQRFAPGTYVDSHGVLRAVADGSVAVWHHNERERAEHGLTGRCERRGLHPRDVAYDPETGAPWCPDCWPWERRRQVAEAKKKHDQAVKKLFGNN